MAASKCITKTINEKLLKQTLYDNTIIQKLNNQKLIIKETLQIIEKID